jgi:hypothetical protein
MKTLRAPLSFDSNVDPAAPCGGSSLVAGTDRRAGELNRLASRSMAGSTGEPVGPFPGGADPEEFDRLRRRVLWKMPSGLYLVGSRLGDRRNLMTLNWATVRY